MYQLFCRLNLLSKMKIINLILFLVTSNWRVIRLLLPCSVTSVQSWLKAALTDCAKSGPTLAWAKFL